MFAGQADGSYGDLAVELASGYELTADPWQAAVLDDWLSYNYATSEWSCLTCGLAVPRQNGKNAVIEIREIFGLVGRNEHILHTAHLVKTAQKHWRRLKRFFGTKVNDPNARFPELNALVAEIRNVNGQEAIYLKRQCVRCGGRETLHDDYACAVPEWVDGGSIEIAARSKSSGRGFSVDVLVCDEAQDMDDDALEALLATTSASPKEPQWIFTGTPPGPNVEGPVFLRVRDDALGDHPESVSWNEWSDEDSDCSDPDVWARTNPALGRRLRLSVIRGEQKVFSADGFARERCGRWPKRKGGGPIAESVWVTLLNDQPPAAMEPPTAIAVDMSHDRVIAISGCWAQDTAGLPGGQDIAGRFHVELLAVDHMADPLAAANWIVDRAGKRIPVIIDAKSPAASMAPVLKARKVDVHLTNAPEMGRGCELVTQDIQYRRLRHAGQEQLNQAALGVRKRDIGEAGLFGWDRSNPDVNIAPMVSITLARYGVTKAKKRSNGTGRGSRGSNSSRREAVLLSA